MVSKQWGFYKNMSKSQTQTPNDGIHFKSLNSKLYYLEVFTSTLSKLVADQC